MSSELDARLYQVAQYLDLGTMWMMAKHWSVEWSRGRVLVTEIDRRGVPLAGPTYLDVIESYTEAYVGGRGMASKWIARAIKGATKQTRLTTLSDPYLFAKRPALADFMCEAEGAEGEMRELSVLMICASTDGCRVGLKDNDAGGWLWREATTVAEALDAIEKALQGGDVRWAVPGGKKGRK